MSGFWTKTPDGHTVHINGSPKMSKEQAFALSVMIDKALQGFEGCTHFDSETIHTSHYRSHYSFEVQRCQQCGETVVKLFGNNADGSRMYLTHLRTEVKPWATNKPAAGYAYYWRFDGLWHSTPPIAPAPDDTDEDDPRLTRKGEWISL